MSEDTTDLGFEAAFEKLQETVRKLEGGQLKLEDSLKVFEEGVKLTRYCQRHLADAEKKVQVLTQQSTLENFDSSTRNSE